MKKSVSSFIVHRSSLASWHLAKRTSSDDAFSFFASVLSDTVCTPTLTFDALPVLPRTQKIWTPRGGSPTVLATRNSQPHGLSSFRFSNFSPVGFTRCRMLSSFASSRSHVLPVWMERSKELRKDYLIWNIRHKTPLWCFKAERGYLHLLSPIHFLFERKKLISLLLCRSNFPLQA